MLDRKIAHSSAVDTNQGIGDKANIDVCTHLQEMTDCNVDARDEIDICHSRKANVNGNVATTRCRREHNLVHLNIVGENNMNDQDCVIDRLILQTKDGRNKGVQDKVHKEEQLRDNSLSQSKAASRNIKAGLRKTFRQLKKMPLLKLKTRKPKINMAIGDREFGKNKAENNNWMLDDDEPPKPTSALAVPTFNSKNRASSFSSFVQSNYSSKSMFRASSINGSGYFSNAHTKNSNVLYPNKQDSRAAIDGSKHMQCSGDMKQMSLDSKLCRACGNQSLEPGRLVCTNCSAHVRQSNHRSGALTELKAYAQSLASNLIKILLLSPENVKCEDTDDESSASATDLNDEEESMTKTEDLRSNHGPEVALHRYMTEINMASLQKAPSKNVINKSVSYDEGSDWKDKLAPLNWLGHGKTDLSDSSSEPGRSDKLLCQVEDCSSSYNNCTQLMIQDGETIIETCKMDHFKFKAPFKQNRVERAKTDGDLRSNSTQQTLSNKKIPKDEHKKGFEYQRSKGRTFHEIDGELCEFLSKQSEGNDYKDGIDIRQKVIHEGSPVDPPCSSDSKKTEENKWRKPAFTRSATTPYRNNVNRKDVAIADRVIPTEIIVKVNKPIMKSTVRTNKASTLRKENSMGDRMKVHESLTTQSENLTDSFQANCAFSFTSRRCTSYDGGQPHQRPCHSVHRSISWSMFEGDDEGSKQRRAAASASNNSIKIHKRHNGNINVMSSPSYKERKITQAKDNVLKDLFHLEPSIDSIKNDTANERSFVVTPSGEALPRSDSPVELTQPKSTSNFNSRRYYSRDVERTLSPCIEEDAIVDYSETDLAESQDYFNVDTAAFNELVPSFSSELSVNTVINVSRCENLDNDVYHDQMTLFSDADISESNTSPWYSSPQEMTSRQMTTGRRELSLESKSSTSFHSLNNARSSHSDESLLKYSDFWEQSNSRRQLMYTETDVDTGVIYHLAKRQAIKSHVPPYHELNSRDIYTMSGDVITSTSSNSNISTKTDVSESYYTGGFYKEDPFYSSTGQSKESNSFIYFVPEGQLKNTLNDLDIYTGNIFNVEQNDVSQAEHAGLAKASTVAKDANSGRSFVGRSRRQFTYSSCNDSLAARHNSSSWGTLPQHVLALRGDWSNNSSNWHDVEDIESGNAGIFITKSLEPIYTDYKAEVRPAEILVKLGELTEPDFDFYKYEDFNVQYSTKKLRSFEIEKSSGDNIWYSGLLCSLSNECEQKSLRKEQDKLEWQYSDDYFSNADSSKSTKVDNYIINDHGLIMHNSNNNHFDDLYTGFFGNQNASPPVQQQQRPVQEPPRVQENWYQTETPYSQISTPFYEQKYGSFYSSPDSDRKPQNCALQSNREMNAVPKQLATEQSLYNKSKTYLTENILRKYDQSPSTQVDMGYEPPLMRMRKEEKPVETHRETNMVSNMSSLRGFYSIDDDDTYSFEKKVAKAAEVQKAPVVREIKTVGGIVCRENVANKEDYAEDINRDLEPGWTPFTYRYSDEVKHSSDSSDTSRSEGARQRHGEDASYAHNRLYDNIGARNKWREMAEKQESDLKKTKKVSKHKAHQGGDTGKHGCHKSRTVPDVIPDRARGRRTNSTVSKSSTPLDKGGFHKAPGTVTPKLVKRF